MAEDSEPLGPAAAYPHNHPPVININEKFAEEMSLAQRVADWVAGTVGSWPFIITQSVLLAVWIIANTYLVFMIKTHPGFLKAWDPYPFILLNLVLSFQAAYTGPIVMMSQNRQSEKDRLMSQHDFEINQKAEEEIQVIMQHLAYQDELLRAMSKQMESLQSIDRPRPLTD